MDLNKKVTVLTPNARRQNIKITPSTTLLQILEEACQKHGFSSDEYGLKSHNKELDLLQMFRFTGLPNNCLLEMVQLSKKRVESAADICIQLEDGSRNQGQFAPSTNLWDVLVKICPDYAASDKSPVFIYMRKEIYGDDLKSTTLKSLGITGGRTMMRLVDKNPEEEKTQAGVYVPPVVKDAPKEPPKDDEAKPVNKLANKGFAITSQLVQSLKNKEPQEQMENKPEASAMEIPEETAKEPEKPKVEYDWGTGSGRTMMSTDAAEVDDKAALEVMEAEPEVNVIGDRNAVIYSLDSTQKQMEDLPDSFFDLTVNDLKLVLRDLKKVAEGNEDAPLLTAKLRELEESKTILRKIAQYKNCMIRVQFPDRHVLQGIFNPTDKIDDVISFVRGFLTNPDLEFYLFTIPPKTMLPGDKTLLEADCVPTAVLHFGVSEFDALPSMISYLNKKFLMELTSPEGAYFLASKSRLIRGVDPEDSDNNNRISYGEPGPSTGAIPKRPRSDDFRQSTTERKSGDVPKWFRPK